jgi:hypothetical protein
MSGAALRLLAPLWLGLAAVTTLPYLAAERHAPAGTRFLGALFYPDDFHQYLSFAEQAGRGALLFVNKFDGRPQEPALINLEWWLAGTLGRLGGGPALGLHVLRLLALAALLAACYGLLTLHGRTGRERAWGLALVATGSGLGWLRRALGTPGWQIPDLLTGLYPSHQALSNAHFVVGTGLLAASLLLYLRWRLDEAPRWAWLACAWALGLSRPYDMAVFAMVVLAAELWSGRDRPRLALARAFELTWLLPVFVYYALVVGLHPSLGGWSDQSGDLSPPRLEYAFALAPAAALVVAFGRGRDRGAEAPGLVRALLPAWCGCLLALLLLWPSPMAKQYAISLGAALLLWAAAVTPGRALPWAVLALSPTSLFLLWRAFNPFSISFAPASYFTATRFLASACRPAELALAPTDLSLMIAGLTPCHVAVGHRLLTPGFAGEVALATRFYDPATPVAWRLAYLRAKGFAYVALPAGRAFLLGTSSAWTPVLREPLLEILKQEGIERSAR